MDKTDIKSLNVAELEILLSSLDQPKYRAQQIFVWLHRAVTGFSDMTDLPLSLREQLDETCYITVPEIRSKRVSAIDKTIKYLWQLRGGSCVESVLMHYKHGNSICISTQAGCRMGCAFCASSGLGFDRDLTPSELLDQVLFTKSDSGEDISNIVLMGIGEPLDNFENVMKFLHLVNHPLGLNIGMRHISLSTCGLPGGIQKLSGENLQITLSVSLHAPDDETRSKLMPANRACGVEQLIFDCRAYYKKTGRRISYEYAMIKGVNDTPAQAQLLTKLLKGSGGHVNLIALNKVASSGFDASDPEAVHTFQSILEKSGITVTVRRRMGSDIDAACGQLRRSIVSAKRG